MWEPYGEEKVEVYDLAGVKTWAKKYICSECGFIHTVIEDFGHYNFCPNCGADMRAKQDEIHFEADSEFTELLCSMSDSEKQFLVDCLLRDIRSNWSRDNVLRAQVAMHICKNLGGEFLTLYESCAQYISYVEQGEDPDGRFFRDDFPYGYYNMEGVHGYNYTYNDKSAAFKKLTYRFMLCRSFVFEDVDS